MSAQAAYPDLPRFQAWHARRAIAGPEAPHDVVGIAEGLSDEAQIALMSGSLCALDLTRAVRLELEFWGLLDLNFEDGKAASDLGVQVWRHLLRWDSDWAAREDAYSAWFRDYFDGAYRLAAPGHEALHRALFLHPDVHELVDALYRAKRPLAVAAAVHVDHAVYLARHRVATVEQAKHRTGRVTVVDLTRLGREVAWHLALAGKKREEIFAGGRQSALSALTGRRIGEAYDAATRLLGGALSQHERRRRLIMLLWIAGHAQPEMPA